MLPLKYKKLDTTNNARCVPDQNKKEKIVNYIINRDYGNLAPEHLKLAQGILMPKIDAAFLGAISRVTGVCAAMVCLWALETVLADAAPAAAPKAPDVKQAAVLQGKYVASTISRQMRDKIPEFEAADKAGFEYMFKTKNLKLIDEQAMGIFPGFGRTRDQFDTQVTNLLNKTIVKNGKSPHIMSLQMAAGGHTVGLCHDGIKYIVFEPNHGLYEFPDGPSFTQHFSQHLMQVTIGGSPWTLRQIGLRVA